MKIIPFILAVIIWFPMMYWLFYMSRPVKFVDMSRFQNNETAEKGWRERYDIIPLEYKL